MLITLMKMQFEPVIGNQRVERLARALGRGKRAPTPPSFRAPAPPEAPARPVRSGAWLILSRIFTGRNRARVWNKNFAARIGRGEGLGARPSERVGACG